MYIDALTITEKSARTQRLSSVLWVLWRQTLEEISGNYIAWYLYQVIQNTGELTLGLAGPSLNTCVRPHAMVIASLCLHLPRCAASTNLRPERHTYWASIKDHYTHLTSEPAAFSPICPHIGPLLWFLAYNPSAVASCFMTLEKTTCQDVNRGWIEQNYIPSVHFASIASSLLSNMYSWRHEPL